MEKKAVSEIMLSLLLISILALSFNVGVLRPVQADSLDLTDLRLEKSEEWSSGVVNSVFCSDVDGDGDVEVVTGGTDLRIWYWDGETLTQETSAAIAVNSVFCSNVDHDFNIEIVTGGDDVLEVYRWNGVTLTREAGTHTIALDSVFCGDVDGDGQVEIVGGGVGGFSVWRVSGLDLTEETSTTTSATSVYCSDVDGDGNVEIVGSASNWLRVWRWSGTKLTLEASVGGSSPSYMNSVFAGDVDADGDVEIVTGGYFWQTMPPFPYYCELRVWNSSGTAPTLETSKTWGSPMHYSSDDAYVRSVYCGNADNDADIEMITGGWLDGEGPLRSWSIKQGSIVLENYMNWNAVVRSVFMGDVDGDEQTEIITGGNAGSLSQLRIWSVLRHPMLHSLIQETSGGLSEVDSVCADDVDGDGVREIITGGSYRQAGEPREYYGQLQICSWDEVTITQEAYEDWNLGATLASVYSVCADDLDEDGIKEIVTVSSGSGYGELRIWNWNGATLTLEKLESWSNEVSSVCADDVDGDGVREIITGGYIHDGERYNGQLRIWKWDGTTLTLETSQEWFLAANTYVYAVFVSDVDGDAAKEIVTGGSADYQGQLRILNWNGVSLTLEASQEWSSHGIDARVNSVSIDDIDGDAAKEIVAGGVEKDGNYDNGQLTVWRWNGASLTLEVLKEWVMKGNTVVNSIRCSDIDGSGVEIVTGGATANVTHSFCQLRTWRWDGTTLRVEASKEWVASAVHSVCLGDVDDDSVVEIETGESNSGNAPLKIWYVENLDASITSVVASKTILGQGYSMSINVTVENRGNVALLSFLVTTYYGNVPIGTHLVSNLPPGGSTELIFVWDETAIENGDYIISAYAIANGDIHDADNNLSGGTVRVTIPGDVNGDKIVDVFDILEIKYCRSGPPAGPGGYDPNVDINTDGNIDVFDILIAKAHLGQSW